MRIEVHDFLLYNISRGENMNQKYVAIIGDIKNSKTIKNRDEFRKQFRDAIEYINEKYKDQMAAKLVISSGDEFEGLFSDAHDILDIVFELEKRIHPYKIRFGLGIGNVKTKIDYDNTLEIDGTSYHYAREMINFVKENETSYSTYVTNYAIKSTEDMGLVNSSLAMISILKNSWSERQRQVMEEFLDNDMSQMKTSEKLGILQSSVSRALKSSNFYNYMYSKNMVNAHIERLVSDGWN